jgi:VanZ like family
MFAIMLKFTWRHMNTRAQVQAPDAGGTSRWSIRILVLALAGIFFLTLYPFRFARAAPSVANPFLLGHSPKSLGTRDAFLNMLLFVPYGFGLAAQIQQRRRALRTIAIAFATGALLSYVIEFLQLYIPERDSGWNDVITNSTGALLGAVVFLMCGLAVLQFLRNFEKAIEAFATRRNAAITLLVYFAVWFAVSGRLQKETRLSNWKSDAYLLVGNSPRARWPAWKGEVYDLQFWNHALPRPVAQQLTAPGSTASLESGVLVAYEFSAAPPFTDREHLLPDLKWVSRNTNSADPPPVVWNGAIWAVTQAPVSALVADIEKERQFSVRVRCTPSQISAVSAAIVSVSQPDGTANLQIRQETDALLFWFRTPLTARRPLLTWRAPKVFVANQTRDLLFSYDGANLSVAIDGKRIDTPYHLGPGAALARLVRGIKPPELQGYRYIFYALVFFPAGSFVALAWREHSGRIVNHLPIAIPTLVLSPILLEILLVRIGGQSISVENIALAFAALWLGAIWINLGAAHEMPSQTASDAALT